MITTALFSIMAVVITVTFVVGLKIWNSGSSRAIVREEAVLAMDEITRGIIQAGTVTQAESSAITFSADIDNDGANETATFSQDAENHIMRSVDGVSTILASDVEALAFSYVDLNNNNFTPLTQAERDNIRVVNIALTMERPDETYSLSSSVYARNQGP